jgi:hypothetical protein
MAQATLLQPIPAQPIRPDEHTMDLLTFKHVLFWHGRWEL